MSIPGSQAQFRTDPETGREPQRYTLGTQARIYPGYRSSRPANLMVELKAGRPILETRHARTGVQQAIETRTR
jgi:hypothetical protein